MAKKTDSVIPAHLSDLLSPTPSGAEKLIAAWDGLGVETQIQLLATLRLPAYLGYGHSAQSSCSFSAFLFPAGRS